MFEEHGLILEGHKRYYKIDFSSRNFDLENTVPHLIRFGLHEIINNSWGSMIQRVSNILISESSKSKEEILAFRSEGTQQEIFSLINKTNWRAATTELFVNCNVTSVRGCMLLQDLFDFFGYDRKEITLIIRRYPLAEPKIIREYVINDVKEQFMRFLMIEKGFSPEKSEKIVVEYFDRINNDFVSLTMENKKSKHPKSLPSHDNFFLFDDYITYKIYKDKFLAAYSEKYNDTLPKRVNNTRICLNYLAEFYKKLKY